MSTVLTDQTETAADGAGSLADRIEAERSETAMVAALREVRATVGAPIAVAITRTRQEPHPTREGIAMFREHRGAEPADYGTVRWSYAADGECALEWGHYTLTLERAREDFAKRVEVDR